MDKRLRAFEIAKYTISFANKSNLGIKKLIKEWNDPTSIMTRCAELYIDMNNDYSSIFSRIAELLVIKCKHPKKDHDICKGVKYCMNCNSDL